MKISGSTSRFALLLAVGTGMVSVSGCNQIFGDSDSAVSTLVAEATDIADSTDSTDGTSGGTDSTDSTDSTSGGTDTTDSASGGTDGSSGEELSTVTAYTMSAQDGTIGTTPGSKTLKIGIGDDNWSKVEVSDVPLDRDSVEELVNSAKANNYTVWRNGAKVTVVEDGETKELPSQEYVATNGCDPSASDCVRPISAGSSNYEQLTKTALSTGTGARYQASELEVWNGVNNEESLQNSRFGQYAVYDIIYENDDEDRAPDRVNSVTVMNGFFADNPTTNEQMDALKSNGVEATYSGRLKSSSLLKKFDPASPSDAFHDYEADIEVRANFGDGTVKGQSAELMNYESNEGIGAGVAVRLNEGKITGNTYSGNSVLVDSNSNSLQNGSTGEYNGAFAGDNAGETVGAFQTQGKVNGEDVILQGSYGAVKESSSSPGS